MGIFDKFKSGLGKSSSSLTDGFKNIFSKKKIDSTILEEFEDDVDVLIVTILWSPAQFAQYPAIEAGCSLSYLLTVDASSADNPS